MTDEKRAFYAEVDKLARRCHELAAEFNDHPHHVADCVKKSVTLPYHAEPAPDRALAEALASATDEDQMLEAENEILDRLDVSPDETELGLTENAVERIERFVSEQTGSEWTYAKLPPGVVEPDETVRSIFR